MTRRIVLTVVALLLVAAPAVAKGVDGVVLTAGDQEVAIGWQHVYGENGDLASLVDASHLYDVDWWNGDRHDAPVGDLGPVVVATWNFPDPVESVIVQYLYPFAESGPVGRVLPDQEYFDQTIVGAWHPLHPEVVDVLTAAGIDLTRLETPRTSGLLIGSIVLALCGIIAARRWRDGTIRR
jgi:hypothetical protein